MLYDFNPLLMLAIILAAGVFAGNLASKVKLPTVTGQILVGILIGPSVINLFDVHKLEVLQPVTHFALGLIAMMVGSHLNLKQLRNAGKRLGVLLLLEATITPIVVIAFLSVFTDLEWTMIVLLGALAISTAPATIIAIVRETRSKGVFVKTLVAAVALNNMACIAIFEIAHAAVRVSLDANSSPSMYDFIVAPFTELMLSAVLGGGAGLVLVGLTRKTANTGLLATASVVTILLTSGLAHQIGVSTLLACLFLGVVISNLAPDDTAIGHNVLENLEGVVFAAFFTLAGMELDLKYALPGGLVALVIVFARFSGKVMAGYFAMWMAQATKSIRRYLGLALVPQAGVAVGLIIFVKEDPVFSELANLFLAVGLTSVLLNEIIGPITTKYALIKSGDAGNDRARLIDFICEENINTDLNGKTKDEVIETMTDILVKSTNVSVEKSKLLKSVMDRENMISTCIGGGLMVPHGILEEGDAIIGAMGISKKGLKIPTPDGKPVHCVVLLGTPESQRDRHLEVLAALARAIGKEPTVQKRLYKAKTPAHAYNILNSEKAKNFNYFIEDEA